MDGPREPADRSDFPSDDTILAAVRRAGLHESAEHKGVSARLIFAHLAIPMRSGPARTVRKRLAALEQQGRLEVRTVHGIAVWRLTPAGRRRLTTVERTRGRVGLPESPQHLAWRKARAAAEEELDGFASALAEGVAEAGEMLAALKRGEAPHSDNWFLLGRRLRAASWRLGSAWHCLAEWPEPDDDRPDRDVPGPGEPASVAVLRGGRRNITLWTDID